MRSPGETPRYARLAARALSRRQREHDTPAPISLPDRAATMQEIQHALQARNRRRAAARWVTAGAVAAAAAIALFVGWHNCGGGRLANVAAPAPAAVQTPPGLTIASLEGSGA